MVAKGTHDGVGVIGKYHSGYDTCYFSFGGSEHEHSPSDCEVLVDLELGTGNWESGCHGNFPSGRYCTGVHDGDGSELSVIKAEHEGVIIPGKMNPNYGLGYVPWGGEEHEKSEYEVLMDSPGLMWKPVEGGNIPLGAIGKMEGLVNI